MAKEFDYPTYDAGGRVKKYKEGGKVDVTDVVKKVKKKVHDEAILDMGKKELRKHRMAKRNAGPYKVPRKGSAQTHITKTTYVDKETGKTEKIPKKYQSPPKHYYGVRDTSRVNLATGEQLWEKGKAHRMQLRKEKKQVDKHYKLHKEAVKKAKKRSAKSKADVGKTVKKILKGK